MDCSRLRVGATTILVLLAVMVALLLSALAPSRAGAVIALRDVPPTIKAP